MTRSALRARWRVALVVLLFCCSSAAYATAADHTGTVSVAGVPVPGATVTATQSDQRVVTLTDERGVFLFMGLAEGTWTIDVTMLGFAPARVEVASATATSPVTIALTVRPFAELVAMGATVRADTILPSPGSAGVADVSPSATNDAAPVPQNDASELARQAADGLLVNGSVNNGASSPFAQAAAFGNNRNLRRSLYNGMFGAVVGNSAWDSRPFSFTGMPGQKPSYDDLQLLATFGGPIPTRGPVASRPNLFTGYQRSIENSAAAQSALVPTALERTGDFSQSTRPSGSPVTLFDPATGAPFDANRIPTSRLSPEALALLNLYPMPNIPGGGRFNYQAPVLTRTEREALQARVTKTLNDRNQLLVNVQYQRTQTASTSLFDFTGTNGASTLDVNATWSRRVSPFFSTRVRYQFTRATTDVVPHFAGDTDVSGLAGILGGDRVAGNWGPPSLTFASGILGLADLQYEESSFRTHGALTEGLLNRGRHNLTFGAGARRVALDAEGQQNGRGAFAFTGGFSGSDLGDFILGMPHTAALALGNSDKALRAHAVEAYITDDWRVAPGLTVNAGLRWDYEAPFAERLGRLSNLDIAPDFSAAAIITPTSATGAVTGRSFGQALLRPDRSGIQPRLGVAWRPIAGSSLVLRGGYGIYRNTSTYQPIALLMAQQPPFSTALSVESSPATPLTLRDGFLSQATSPATFAVDPNFRIGSAHNWQVIAQRDLPGSLTMSAAYLGAHGSHLMQEYLPNTVPAGAIPSCPTCPVGFAYLTSNGTSDRHAGQFQLRRRLRNGLQASGQYTYSTATDNAGAFTGAALTGAAVAQDWRNIEAERGPSSFNQQHLFTAEVQYTTGVGIRGGGLLAGTKGALVKGWTFTSQLTTGSGFPVTPVFLGAVPGTGISGTLRATLSGGPTVAPDGNYLNPGAYTAPAPGTWGDVGRNSALGPRQFSMSAGVARSFPWGERATLDWRIDATNVLNVVTYSSVNAIVGSPQFGLPTRANPMRKIQSTIRLRF